MEYSYVGAALQIDDLDSENAKNIIFRSCRNETLLVVPTRKIQLHPTLAIRRRCSSTMEDTTRGYPLPPNRSHAALLLPPHSSSIFGEDEPFKSALLGHRSRGQPTCCCCLRLYYCCCCCDFFHCTWYEGKRFMTDRVPQLRNSFQVPGVRTSFSFPQNQFLAHQEVL